MTIAKKQAASVTAKIGIRRANEPVLALKKWRKPRCAERDFSL
jgi:ABC-type transporter Mla maintaining outer membrane lipid asymmetry permease subunit MlaE